MTTEDSLEKRFNKHPEPSINGITSLDDEFISIIRSKPDLDGLIEKGIDNSEDPSSIYTKIISKLGLLESLDIKTLLTDYVSSEFWNSLGLGKQLEFIDRTLESQEEKEQNALEEIGLEKTQIKSDQAAQGKPKKIDIPFDVVADRIRDEFHILTMRDNQQLYIYKDGVFRSEGAEAILDTEIRNAHHKISVDYWNRYNRDFPSDHIPKATIRFVREVLAHIRAYTHITRDSIEKVQSNISILKTVFSILRRGKLKTIVQKSKVSVKFR